MSQCLHHLDVLMSMMETIKRDWFTPGDDQWRQFHLRSLRPLPLGDVAVLLLGRRASHCGDRRLLVLLRCGGVLVCVSAAGVSSISPAGGRCDAAPS